MESPSGGVAPMAIAGRMVRERERLIGMTDEERAWRAQWLKDQVLAPEEPIVPKGYYEARYNPIRRFYRAPLEKLQQSLVGSVGLHKAEFIRHFIGKTGLIILGLWSITYYFKYNTNDWTRKGGWKVSFSREKIFPSDKNFPHYEKRSKPSEYGTHKFHNSPI
ncbi:NADH dehydrogenase [ubiquinone] 1 beta subcomplex subunit 6 [Orussus abietinus]|uniref:NADH dehydrogenase [ubiquinone] 1 beta subcomplex subunit 6 n=1 Tax=Orussus abietinus TaxID=222816 RepID=UPI000625A760|nr:NADH dehydrogenase [ubiquinone] 1 beta subcomplex subunit 6 [Orussus abietinus]